MTDHYYRAYGSNGLSLDPIVDAQHAIVNGKTLQESLKISDEQMIQYYDYANELYSQKNYEDASDIFFFLTQINPLVQNFWLAFANAEWMNDRFEAAFGAYQMAITLDPFDPESYLNLAKCCVSNNDRGAALDYLNLMAETCPASPALEGAMAYKKKLEMAA